MWEEELIEKRVIQITESENPINDQELLNNVFAGKFFHLDHNLNKMVLNETTLERQIGIYHFVGKLKPWNIYGFIQPPFTKRVFGKNTIFSMAWKSYNSTVRKMFLTLFFNPRLVIQVWMILSREKTSALTQLKWLIKGNISN
jgi:lipopolysaccharide biosynthesis glycosyltransferase